MFMGTYNIQVLRGARSTRTLLSCRNTGQVELALLDDGSGRQRWDVNMIDTGVFTFKVSGGTDPGKEYLVWSGLNGVLLGQYSDNGAGWVLAAVTTNPEIPAYYTAGPFEGPSVTRILSCSADGKVVDLVPQDDESGRQRWQLQGPAIPPNFLWASLGG
jgi:hypothetical protein